MKSDTLTQLQSTIEAIKADKSIAQPWRNYGLKHLNEAQAHIEKGMRVSNLKPPADLEPSATDPQCTCPPGGLRRDCPVHSGQV